MPHKQQFMSKNKNSTDSFEKAHEGNPAKSKNFKVNNFVSYASSKFEGV